MTLHLDGVHICHILNTGFENCIVNHFQPKNEMRILVKMVYLEGICMVKADSHVVREQCNEENPKGPVYCALQVTTMQICHASVGILMECLPEGGWFSRGLRPRENHPPEGRHFISIPTLAWHICLIIPNKPQCGKILMKTTKAAGRSSKNGGRFAGGHDGMANLC